MRLTRGLTLLAASCLVVTASLTTAIADAAGTGTLHVSLVDENGDPTPGGILVLTQDEDYPGIQQNAVSTFDFALPPGEYGVVSITPWGGISCVAVEPCSYAAIYGGVYDVTGEITVAEGAVTPTTVAGAVPAVLVGPARVGTTLSVSYSEGMEALLEVFGLSSGGVPGVQWLRDGSPISGATGDTYTPRGADAGRKVSAVLTWGLVATSSLEGVTGEPVKPYTTGAVSITKVPTATFTRLLRSRIGAGQRGVARVDATAKNMIVTGKATVTVGDWSVTRALRNGRLSVRLPALKPGSYRIESTYGGTNVFKPSTAKVRTLVVTAR